MENNNQSTLSGFQLCKEFKKLKLTDDEFKTIQDLCNPPPYYVNKDTWLIGRLETDRKTFEHYLVYFATYFEVSCKEIDMDTGIARTAIRYYNGLDVVESTFSSDIFTKFGIKELFQRGIRFSERDSEYALDYLIKSESQAPIRKSFTKHRFLLEDGKLKYFYNRLIGDKQHLQDYIYRGSMDLNPTGNLDVWLEMVRNEVIGNPNLEFVLMASFSSAILSVLNLQFDFGSIMLHLANHSSKGKTTAAMLAASVWSNPLLNRGTAISYNATENALTDFVSSCNGLCVVLDESAVNQTSNLQKLLYELTLGRSKMRLNGDGSQKDIKAFSSVIISTSEVNFISDESLNGIKARVFEVKGQLTKSAENADRIKNVIIQNYALAGEPFLIYLTSRGLNNIVGDYNQVKDELCKQYEDSYFSNVEASLIPRILSKFSILLLASCYFEAIFKIEIDSKKLFDYLLKSAQNVEMSPTVENKIVDIVFSDITENSTKYYDYPDVVQYADKVSPLYGLIRESREEGFNEACILDKHFDKLMTSNGFTKTEYNRSLRILRKNGVFISQPDRLRTKIPISRNRPESMYYVFKYNKNNF